MHKVGLHDFEGENIYPFFLYSLNSIKQTTLLRSFGLEKKYVEKRWSPLYVGRSGLVAEFQLRGRRVTDNWFTLNLSRVRCAPVSVAWNFEEWVVTSGVIIIILLGFKITRYITKQVSCGFKMRHKYK